MAFEFPCQLEKLGTYKRGWIFATRKDLINYCEQDRNTCPDMKSDGFDSFEAATDAQLKNWIGRDAYRLVSPVNEEEGPWWMSPQH